MAKFALVALLLSIVAGSYAQQQHQQVFTLDASQLGGAFGNGGGNFITLDAGSFGNLQTSGQQFIIQSAPQQQHAQQFVTLQHAAAPITTSGAAVTRRQELVIEHDAQPRAAAVSFAPVQQEIRTVAVEQPQQQQQFFILQHQPQQVARQEIQTVAIAQPQPQPQQVVLLQHEQPRREVQTVFLQPVAAPVVRTTQRPTTTTTTTTTTPPPPPPAPVLLQAPIVRAPVQQRIAYGVKGGRLY